MKKRFLFLLIILSFALVVLAISKSGVFVVTNSCVGCGDCLDVCPVDAIIMVDGKAVIDADKCILCEICIRSCTYDAIRKDK